MSQPKRECSYGRSTPLHIEIPADLGVTEEQARLDFAVGIYSSRTVSLARAARLAGRNRIEFQRILTERGIPLAYDTADLDDDVATLKRLDGEVSDMLANDR
jgi:predicted HTH domain antitoxin